jgi:hypothetical protein
LSDVMEPLGLQLAGALINFLLGLTLMVTVRWGKTVLLTLARTHSDAEEERKVLINSDMHAVALHLAGEEPDIAAEREAVLHETHPHVAAFVNVAKT